MQIKDDDDKQVVKSPSVLWRCHLAGNTCAAAVTTDFPSGAQLNLTKLGEKRSIIQKPQVDRAYNVNNNNHFDISVNALFTFCLLYTSDAADE